MGCGVGIGKGWNVLGPSSLKMRPEGGRPGGAGKGPDR